MKLEGVRVDLISAVGDDWDYVFEMVGSQGQQKCSKELLPMMAREHCFKVFIAVEKKTGEKLGTVHSNYIEEVDGFSVDLTVGKGNSGYIRECFDLFADFMSRFDDRLYGYVAKDDEKIMRLSELFGFEHFQETEQYYITMREI